MHTTHTHTRLYSCPFRSTMTSFFLQVTAQFWEKCTKWPPKWPWHEAYCMHLQSPNFHPFHYMMNHFRITGQLSFTKGHQMTPKWPWYVQGKIYSYLFYVIPDQIFICFALWWVLGQVLQKCIQWPQNDLDMFKIKSTHMHITCIHNAQIFIRFPLQWGIFWGNWESFQFPTEYKVKINNFCQSQNFKFQKTTFYGNRCL